MEKIILNDEDIAVAEILISTIKESQKDKRTIITYEQLSERLKEEKNINIYPEQLRIPLEHISIFYNEKGFPFITGIVVKVNNLKPGTGYYKVLQGYGLNKKQQEDKRLEAQTYKDWKALQDALYI